MLRDHCRLGGMQLTIEVSARSYKNRLKNLKCRATMGCGIETGINRDKKWMRAVKPRDRNLLTACTPPRWTKEVVSNCPQHSKNIWPDWKTKNYSSRAWIA